MSHPHLSLTEPAPPGFDYAAELRPQDLHGAPVAVFAGSIEQAEDALRALRSAEVAGVVVTWTEGFLWVRRAPLLYQLGLPPDARDELEQRLTPVLDALSDVPGRQHGAPAAVGPERLARLKRENEQLTATQQMLANILESFPGVVFWKDRSSTYLGCNRNFSAGAGLAEPAELIGKTDYDLPWADTEAEAYRRADREVMESGVPQINIIETQLQVDGRVVWFDTNKVPLFDPDGNVIGVLGTSNDITERRRAEEGLAAANARLLEEDRRKNEFLGLLSHELRNPLSPIRNSVYILQRTVAADERARRSITVIDRQVSHLTHLVDDLLDITRIMRGKVRLQPSRVDLADVTRRTVEDHGALLERRVVVVDVPRQPVWIMGDLTRLTQVIGNLLTNAAKFTPEGGRIAVTLSAREEHAFLEVADTGIGIDRDTLLRLFQPFAQADRSLDRSRGGLGLGLALVKELIELHGGQVAAHSEGPGTGARFTITLPIDSHAREQQEPDGSRDTAVPRRRVLVIEDNQDAADSLAEALRLSGHVVTITYDGASGISKARETRPDVVLCDIGLPAGMDGYAVARALRADPTTRSSFLVALTGYARPADRQRALNAGFDAHLAKPPDMAAIEKMLSDAPSLLDGSIRP